MKMRLMKNFLLTTMVILMTAFVSLEANAELVLSTTNGGSFTFDPTNAMGGSSLIVNNDEGLNDMAIYLGYRTGAFGNQTTEFRQLTTGTAIGGTVAGVASNTGVYDFDTVSFNNGAVTVDALANFRLTDATGFNGDPDPRAHVLYNLSLTTSGVQNSEGSLLSFVGFDFNGDSTDAIQANEFIPGFGNSEVAVGSPDGNRALVGDFTFAPGRGGSVFGTTNTNIDAFNGLIGANLPARFNGAQLVNFVDGDLGFGVFSDLEGRDVDRTDTTAGVFGFRSVTATNTIPEPSTLLMASMGLGMVAFRRRRK